jgi:membrane-associated phospholipid phosphatase
MAPNKNRPWSICVFCGCLVMANHVAASGHIEMAGNILEFALPAAAAAMTIYKSDWAGSLQFGESLALSEGVTGILKYTVKERRPNGEDNYSFPSGHTSISCVSSEFMRKRYGWWYGAPMYALAAFVGYSRIESKHHYVHDVAAGAAIGFASGFIFTKPLRGVNVSGTAMAGNYTINCTGDF